MKKLLLATLFAMIFGMFSPQKAEAQVLELTYTLQSGKVVHLDLFNVWTHEEHIFDWSDMGKDWPEFGITAGYWHVLFLDGFDLTGFAEDANGNITTITATEAGELKGLVSQTSQTQGGTLYQYCQWEWDSIHNNGAPLSTKAELEDTLDTYADGVLLNNYSGDGYYTETEVSYTQVMYGMGTFVSWFVEGFGTASNGDIIDCINSYGVSSLEVEHTLTDQGVELPFKESSLVKTYEDEAEDPNPY